MPARLRVRKQQHGQAMVEAVVACALVMVPLFLAIPVIAKYQDMRAHVVQGARYAAWERTVWFGGSAAKPATLGPFTSEAWDANEKSDDAIRKEIGTRILSRTPAPNTPQPFSTSGDASQSSYVNGSKMLWADRRGNTLLQDYGDIAQSAQNGEAPGIVNDIVEPLVSIISIVSNFTVDTNSKFTATMTLSAKEVAFNTNTDGLGPCNGCPVDYIATSNPMYFSDKNVIVANGWSANGPGQHSDLNTTATAKKTTVYKQVRGLTPTSIFKPKGTSVFSTVLDVIKVISLVIFPELSTLDLGRLEVDRVPADRLQ